MPLPELVFTTIGEVLENKDARQRIIWLLEQLKSFFPEPVDDAFISETRDSEGRQTLVSVWAFTRSFAIEFSEPLESDHFDVTPLRQLSYMEVFKNAYDFNIPRVTETSTMAVIVRFGEGMRGRFLASRVNCVHLARITRERLLPALTLYTPP